MPSRLIIRPQKKPLSGVESPCERFFRSIMHRALLFGSVVIRAVRAARLAYGSDNLGMLRALAALESALRRRPKGHDARCAARRPLRGLTAPKEPINCGHSPTICAATHRRARRQPFQDRACYGSAGNSRPQHARPSRKPLVRRGAQN